MKLTTRKSFEKDIEKINSKKLAVQVSIVIEELENSTSLSEINNVKKMKTQGSYYRIRVGNYRLGFRYDSPDSIVLLRFMHRKNIYTYFP